MQIIPTQAVPSQVLTALLGNQACEIKIYQRSLGLFCDLLVNGALIIGGVICENRNRIVRSVYLGFSGDLMFIDTQGNADPIYTGLGTQFVLAYLAADELPAGRG